MLIQADKIRPIVVVATFVIGLFLWIAVVQRHALLAAIDTVVVQFAPQLLPGFLNVFVSVGSWFTNGWLALGLLVCEILLLWLLNYRLAAMWWTVTQIVLVFAIMLLSLFARSSWSGGLTVSPSYPTWWWVLWLQAAAFAHVIIITRLNRRIRTRGAVILWLLIGMIAFSGLVTGKLLVSGWLGGVILGYFWWALSTQIYYAKARDWQQQLRMKSYL